MNRKHYLQYSKLFFALLGISAVMTEIVVLNVRGVFSPVNFFSFFTIQSNIFAAVVIAISAYMIGRSSVKFAFLRGAAALYMTMTGAIFAVLLSNIDPRLLTAIPWDNVVLHYIMPVVMLIDWIIDRPASKLNLKQTLFWVLVPFVYLAYSMVRGVLVGWYPYPFLNPNVTGGYGPIVIICLAITGFVLVTIWIITQLQHVVVQPSKRRVS